MRKVALMQLKQPIKFTSITFCHLIKSDLWPKELYVIPAQLIKTSLSLSLSSKISLTQLETSSKDLTSTFERLFFLMESYNKFHNKFHLF